MLTSEGKDISPHDSNVPHICPSLPADRCFAAVCSEKEKTIPPVHPRGACILGKITSTHKLLLGFSIELLESQTQSALPDVDRCYANIPASSETRIHTNTGETIRHILPSGPRERAIQQIPHCFSKTNVSPMLVSC
ncbi:hypothetical protein XENOCAPTIV_030293 [Xenoophorus captivus]|uniref:Uncharacterized protein n=1 Tax=Xenoophorus captivus TaxID=1517983 RepID=A0ABV0QGK3_9TELE